jgi:ribosomal subunit interface protein
MEYQVEGQQIDIEPGMQEWIAEHLEKLNTPHDDILHARVTLMKHGRHEKGSEEVRVSLTLPGKILNITRIADTFDDALYQAMDVMTRELRKFRTVRQRAEKTPGPRPKGRIVRLFSDRGYGFIETESHREVYFHANSVHGVPFEKLEVGMTVDLEIEAGHAGPQASRVTLHYPPLG